jgi:ribose/xylose/arabinose/galactoside ABC-type transport system permease subunit
MTDIALQESVKLPRRKIRHSIPWHVVGVWGSLMVLIIVASALSPRFLTVENLLNILRQCSIIAIIGIGQTIVIISGGIDLSVGSMVLLCGVIVAGVLAGGHGIVLAICAGLGVGLAAGLLNGGCVTYFRIPSFVVTLAGLTAYRGLARMYSGGREIPIDRPEAQAVLKPIAQGYLFNTVPLPVLYMAVLFIAAYVLLRHTRLGVYVFAVGGSEQCARFSGVNVRFVLLAVYAISGICSAIAAVVLTSRACAGEVLAGNGYELDAIAAVVIGGTSLAGGVGGVWGTLGGTLILFILLNLFTMLNVQAYFQDVFKGVIIIAAVLLQYRPGQK